MPLVPGVAPPAAGAALRVTVDGRPVAVFNLGGSLHAIDAACTHVGGPLEKGKVHDGTVTCPWHGSVFNLANGSVVHGPASRPVRAYTVVVDGDGLRIDEVAPTGSPR